MNLKKAAKSHLKRWRSAKAETGDPDRGTAPAADRSCMEDVGGADITDVSQDSHVAVSKCTLEMVRQNVIIVHWTSGLSQHLHLLFKGRDIPLKPAH